MDSKSRTVTTHDLCAFTVDTREQAEQVAAALAERLRETVGLDSLHIPELLMGVTGRDPPPGFRSSVRGKADDEIVVVQLSCEMDAAVDPEGFDDFLTDVAGYAKQETQRLVGLWLDLRALAPTMTLRDMVSGGGG